MTIANHRTDDARPTTTGLVTAGVLLMAGILATSGAAVLAVVTL